MKKPIEYKAIAFETKDVDRGKRKAIIMHAGYDNIDRTNDISRKGMFTKSWLENKDDISFYFNHDPTQAPGKAVNFFEDDKGAYTEVFLGTHTLGEDTLKMMEEGIVKNASFGYVAIKTNILADGVRELKEVKHIETSVLTKLQANPLARVMNVQKSFEADDLIELKEAIDEMEKFCKNTKASDNTIIYLLKQISQAKQVLSKYSETTEAATALQPSKENDKAFADQLYLLTLKSFNYGNQRSG